MNILSSILHFFFKTKRDGEGEIERIKKMLLTQHIIAAFDKVVDFKKKLAKNLNDELKKSLKNI